MTSRETKLAAALDTNAALRIQAERLIAAYFAPDSDRPVIINENGPQQREAPRLSAEPPDDDREKAS
jgi:hypothetical protein